MREHLPRLVIGRVTSRGRVAGMGGQRGHQPHATAESRNDLRDGFMRLVPP
ncbi:hypothetical protein RAA17_07270 [Komagataeibacter rhaeticus]|nr:hypothetical protein [Komagataeibacter rhaeticus]